LFEEVEDALLHLGRHADSRVPDRHDHTGTVPFGGNMDAASGGGVPASVVQEVREHLRESHPVTVDVKHLRRQGNRQRQAVLDGGGLCQLDRSLKQLDDVDGVLLE